MLLQVYIKPENIWNRNHMLLLCTSVATTSYALEGKEGQRRLKFLPNLWHRYSLLSKERLYSMCYGDHVAGVISFTIEGDPAELPAISIPKAFLRPVCRARDKGSTQDIMKIPSFPFTCIGLEDEFLKGHT